MNTQENNKMIAEFMEIKSDNAKMRGHLYECPVTAQYVTELEYHTSWDWLMTVVIKCFEIFGNTDTIDYTKLNDALLTCNIDELHRVVVELIKQYNESTD
jgi:hypothetical protein